MVKGYAKVKQSVIGIGNHLGSFSDEDSNSYIEAMEYGVLNGINSLDTAVNYRGMRSEKDTGIAIRNLIESGKVKREDIFVSTKAGLLFGDITARLRPKDYLHAVLEPKGVTINDFCEFEGLYQTLKPEYFQTALDISLSNLGLETVDVHYIHIPEISRAGLGEERFYECMEELFAWYEKMVDEKKIRYYGIALEMLALEPEEERWHMSLERLCRIAGRIRKGEHHFRYIQMPYSLSHHAAVSCMSQMLGSERCTLIEAAGKLDFHIVGSMPFDAGRGFGKASLQQMLSFAINGVDTVNVGSKNIEHIREIIELINHV